MLYMYNSIGCFHVSDKNTGLYPNYLFAKGVMFNRGFKLQVMYLHVQTKCSNVPTSLVFLNDKQ